MPSQEHDLDRLDPLKQESGYEGVAERSERKTWLVKSIVPATDDGPEKVHASRDDHFLGRVMKTARRRGYCIYERNRPWIAPVLGCLDVEDLLVQIKVLLPEPTDLAGTYTCVSDQGEHVRVLLVPLGDPLEQGPDFVGLEDRAPARDESEAFAESLPGLADGVRCDAGQLEERTEEDEVLLQDRVDGSSGVFGLPDVGDEFVWRHRREVRAGLPDESAESLPEGLVELDGHALDAGGLRLGDAPRDSLAQGDGSLCDDTALGLEDKHILVGFPWITSPRASAAAVEDLDSGSKSAAGSPVADLEVGVRGRLPSLSGHAGTVANGPEANQSGPKSGPEAEVAPKKKGPGTSQVLSFQAPKWWAMADSNRRPLACRGGIGPYPGILPETALPWYQHLGPSGNDVYAELLSETGSGEGA